MLVRMKGESEKDKLHKTLEHVENRCQQHQKQLQRVHLQQQQFDASAEEQLAALRQELAEHEKLRSGAVLLEDAARRNLDSFIASLKALEEQKTAPAASQAMATKRGGRPVSGGPKGRAEAKGKAKGNKSAR